MTGTTVAPDRSVSYNQLVTRPRKEIEKPYLNVPPPVCCMHLCIYPLSSMIVFTLWHANKVILVGYLAKEISDTIQDIAIEE